MVMIQVCPHCGFELPCELNDGLTHCSHCNQIFDSSDYNQLLAAAWLVRKKGFTVDQIKWYLKLPDELAILVYTFISDYGYSNQEFAKVLKRLGVAHKSYIQHSE